jgi:hypothetical protein
MINRRQRGWREHEKEGRPDNVAGRPGNPPSTPKTVQACAVGTTMRWTIMRWTMAYDRFPYDNYSPKNLPLAVTVVPFRAEYSPFSIFRIARRRFRV